jgi:hypothetical protein
VAIAVIAYILTPEERRNTMKLGVSIGTLIMYENYGPKVR